MFGYVKPCKPEMKIKEFDTYKAVYCGLCKRLGKVYGPFARLTLSYDFTFLAMVSSGLSSEFSGFRVERCIYNPMKKKACLVPCHDLTFSASAAMVMLYYKLKDNYEDGGVKEKLQTICLMPFAKSARKKAMRGISSFGRACEKMYGQPVSGGTQRYPEYRQGGGTDGFRFVGYLRNAL